MTYETTFGSIDAEVPFEDAEGRCGCGAWADLDGAICGDCFETRWAPIRPTDPMVELLDALDVPTIQLAA